MMRTARFLASFAGAGGARPHGERVSVDLGGERAPGLLFRPGGTAVLPGWIVLHGITVPGIRHPAILRFARALAASGGVVLVPEVAAWTRLRIDPARSETAIGAAARHLAARADVRPGGVSVVGFSFGATQAVVTAARDDLGGAIRTVVGFGGYCDLGRTVRFMMTGEHDWAGRAYRTDPDPYGRWIVAANYLTAVPGLTGMEAVAEGARVLAHEAGSRAVYAGDPVFDALKAEWRSRLDPAAREVWDLIAPPAAAPAPRDEAAELGERIVAAAVARDPEIDPRPHLHGLRRRLELVHGRGDRLVPFTETLRLASHLPPGPEAHATITRLFAHSRTERRPAAHEYPREAWRFLRLLGRAQG